MSHPINKINNFKTVLRNCMREVAANNASVLDSNFANEIENRILKEVDMIHCLRPNLTRDFCDIMLTYDSRIQEDIVRKTVMKYLDQMGFTQNLYIIFRTLKEEYLHIRILVSRICFDGTVVTDSNDIYRSRSILGSLRKEFNVLIH